MNLNFKGFEPVSIKEQQTISAGAGIAAAIGTIASSIVGGISSIINVADDVSDTIIKNKIVNKIDEVEKGEIELKRDGGIRLKWDSLSNSNNSTIIF